jgi:hypothetical protein
MMRVPELQRVSPFLAILAIALSAPACTGDADEITVDRVVHASEVGVDDHLGDADMAELAGGSDLVVHGQVVEVESGVELPDHADSLYSRIRLAVDETLVGEENGEVDVWFLTHILIPPTERLEPVPEEGDSGVWFLMTIDPHIEVDGYIRTNQQGWLHVDGDTSAVSAVRDDTPLGAEVEQLGSLEAVLDRLRGLDP